MDLLRERNRLNHYVKDYLQEDINKQLGTFLQLFFPAEHSLKYALQKVDEIEEIINSHLDEDQFLFDNSTTKKNRITMLLHSAESYQHTIEKKLKNMEHTVAKVDTLKHLQQKQQDLDLIIRELRTQIESSEFHIHHKDILKIKDSELSYFLNKLKSLGIRGFTPKPNKEHATLFKISIFSAIYEKLVPEAQQNDAKKNSEDSTTNQESYPGKRSKN